MNAFNFPPPNQAQRDAAYEGVRAAQNLSAVQRDREMVRSGTQNREMLKLVRGLTCLMCPTPAQRYADMQAERREEDVQRAENVKLASAAAVVDADVELREDVINALVKKGFARSVAANRTNTTQRMLAEAKTLRLI